MGDDPLHSWRALADRLRALTDGATRAALDAGPGTDGMTLRETVHHLAEAQVVAAAILTAALGSPGAVFDWSWMLPFGPWMERMGYATKPVEPSLRLMEALGDYVTMQLAPLDDALARTVRLRDETDGALREVTVADVLRQEVEHADGHLAALESRG